MLHSEWPRSSRKVRKFSLDLMDVDFVRGFDEPMVLSPEFTKDFGVGRWLSNETDSNGIRIVDYDKFLDDFDPSEEVTVEKFDHESGKQRYEKTTLRDFVQNLRNRNEFGQSVYLKDWHAQKRYNIPSDIYEDKLMYFMKMDWINAEKWTNNDENPVDGDYRSFSWSLNVSGMKHWLFLPIKRTSEYFEKYPDDPDFTRHPGIVDEFGLIEWIQSPGEIMIVPPGWHHQVLNMTECLSVNHNMINVFNVIAICNELEERFKAVLQILDDQREIREPADFAEVVEMVLNSDYRITKQKMMKLAQLVESDRLQTLQSSSSILDCDPPSEIENAEFWTTGDIRIIRTLFDQQCGCSTAGKHLLHPNPCQEFIKKMKALDFFFSRIVIRKMAQNDGEFDFYG
uniref:JmjC domain-containing protein n=1 Tax=Panagrolaimus sp. JU765 TaxID=591449 RepID=A0AC34RBX4_9BILA